MPPPLRLRMSRRRRKRSRRRASNWAIRSPTSSAKFAPPDPLRFYQAAGAMPAVFLFRRYHRHMPASQARGFRDRRQVQRRAAFVRTTARNHQSVIAGNDVALAQRRILFDLDRSKADLILTVAGASGHNLGSVAERIRQLRIGFSAVSLGIIDIPAVHELGLTGRAKVVAQRRPALIGGPRNREIPAVTGAHAISLLAPAAAP